MTSYLNHFHHANAFKRNNCFFKKKTLDLLFYFREDPIQENRLKVVDQYRTRKLHELQSTIFVKPARPPDETYNINVTLAESIPLDREIPDTRPESCR